MERIGDFSKRCEVTIKALRWYDKLGLLVPDYIDKFTGYRYYSMEKVAEMQRITELKDIGFSLEEIKQFCSAEKDDEKYNFIWQKRQELEKLTEETEQKMQRLAEIENKLSADMKGEQKMNNMNNKVDFNNEFVNDERVIGRWEIIATVDKKEDFKPSGEYDNKVVFEELYFLPDGEEYWGFSWTKGYVKITFGNGIIVPYELDEADGQPFMFVTHANYGGIWVLRQTDNKRHTKYSIAQIDNIDLPFEDDPQVHGEWISIDYVNLIDEFNPTKHTTDYMHLKSVEFFPDGVFEWTFSDKYKHRWTKGTTMIKYLHDSQVTHTTAPAYEIRNFDEKEYLFLEWKSGDYIWGKRKPGYYVFRRLS